VEARPENAKGTQRTAEGAEKRERNSFEDDEGQRGVSKRNTKTQREETRAAGGAAPDPSSATLRVL